MKITPIRMEVKNNQLVINMITDMLVLLNAFDYYRDLGYEFDEYADNLGQQIIKAGYDPDILDASYIYNKTDDFIVWVIVRSTDRFNSTILQYMIDHYEYDEDDLPYSYMLDPAIRAIVIKTMGMNDIRESMQVSLEDLGPGFSLPTDIDGFALLINYIQLLKQAIKFKDYDLFIAYFKKHIRNPDIQYINMLFQRRYDSLSIDEIWDTIRRSGGFK